MDCPHSRRCFLATLRPALALEQYRGGSVDFSALGDEDGLVLVMRRGRILNFNPASQEKAARVFDSRPASRRESGIFAR